VHRTRNALYGLLAVDVAFFLFGVANKLVLRAVLAGDFTGQVNAMASVMFWFAVAGLVPTVANVVFLVLYARSVCHTRAASLAKAAWVLAIVQIVLGMGLPSLVWRFASESSSLVMLVHASVAVVYWVHLAVFCGSVYRLVGDGGKPLASSYGTLFVGAAVAQSLVGWLRAELLATPMNLGGGAPAPSAVVTTLFEAASWALQVIGVGATIAFILAAVRRLPVAPQTDVRVFD